MYIKITDEHRRICFECRQEYLQLPEANGEYIDDDEEPGHCPDCLACLASETGDLDPKWVQATLF